MTKSMTSENNCFEAPETYHLLGTTII